MILENEVLILLADSFIILRCSSEYCQTLARIRMPLVSFSITSGIQTISAGIELPDAVLKEKTVSVFISVIKAIFFWIKDEPNSFSRVRMSISLLLVSGFIPVATRCLNVF